MRQEEDWRRLSLSWTFQILNEPLYFSHKTLFCQSKLNCLAQVMLVVWSPTIIVINLCACPKLNHARSAANENILENYLAHSFVLLLMLLLISPCVHSIVQLSASAGTTNYLGYSCPPLAPIRKEFLLNRLTRRYHNPTTTTHGHPSTPPFLLGSGHQVNLPAKCYCWNCWLRSRSEYKAPHHHQRRLWLPACSFPVMKTGQ